MIIACDGDGVVCDLHTPWYRRYNRDYGDDLTLERVVSWDVHEYVKTECGKRIYDYLSDPDLYDEVRPIAGALEGVTALRAMGHEVFFVTSCFYGMTDQKARWFERHGFSAARHGGKALPDDFIAVNNKTYIAADLLIDDGGHNVLAWVEARRGKAILLEYPHNRYLLNAVPSAFWSWCHRAVDWPAIVRIVEGFSA